MPKIEAITGRIQAGQRPDKGTGTGTGSGRVGYGQGPFGFCRAKKCRRWAVPAARRKGAVGSPAPVGYSARAGASLVAAAAFSARSIAALALIAVRAALTCGLSLIGFF